MALRQAERRLHAVALHGHAFDVDRDAAGRLVRVLKDWSLPSADIFAVYPERANLSAKVSACVDFLVEWFKRRRLDTRAGLNPHIVPTVDARHGNCRYAG
jgi:DNA-binding transcriptional LysR family regulator